MNIDILLQTIKYITEAPYFWSTMGIIVGMCIFIGAIIFDGDFSIATKAMIGLGSYVFFVIQIQFIRITNVLANNKSGHSEPYMAYASSVTLVIISIFWIIGVILGVFISSYFHKKK